jgi:hypothetical protein
MSEVVTCIVVGASTLVLGIGIGAFVISIFDAKNVVRLEELRDENRCLRDRLKVIAEDVAS